MADTQQIDETPGAAQDSKAERAAAKLARRITAFSKAHGGAEAQLRPQYAVAVLVHQGRRFDHPDSPRTDRCFSGPNG